MSRSTQERGLKKNLRIGAVDTLRKAITTGKYPPGAHLAEIPVSESLGVSRGTLREALRELQHEGLVEYGARGRVAVRLIDSKDVVNTFSVRAALEALAGETLAVSYFRAQQCQQLRDCVEAMIAASHQSLEQHAEADLAFHELLCSLADNDALLRSWRLLEGTIRMCIMYRGVDRALANMSPDRHLEIVNAIESGDPVRTRAVIQAHMTSTAQTLVFGALTGSSAVSASG